MNHPNLKTFLATFLAAMLLYYNAAWAVLRCCHVDEHASLAEVLSKDSQHDGLYRYLSRPGDLPSQIDCLDFDYQIEVLAGSASSPQFPRGTASLTPQTHDGFVAKSLADGHWNKLIGNSFTRGSPPAEPPGPPLYLSLSSLRI